MKSLFFKAILLLLLLMLIKQLANIIRPAYQERDVSIAYKTDQSIKTGVNTIFIGTSRVKRGVIPAIIDSLNPDLHSYNLGENQFTFPYSCKWVEDHLISLPDLKILVIELTGALGNVMDIETWLPYASTSINSTNGWRDEKKMLVVLRAAFIETYLSPAPNFNNFLYSENWSKAGADLHAGYSPYSSLEKKTARSISLTRTNKYTQLATVQDTSYPKTLELPLAFCLAIDRLKDHCEEAHVRLVFLAPPIFASKQEVDIYQSLTSYAERNDIPVLMITHPLLFEKSHRHDRRHFNQPGAQLYSEQLGYALREILEK